MSFLWGNTANQQQDTKKFANISNDQINSNQQAVPVKYLAGRNYVAGDYITPAYNPKAVPVKTQAGKGQSTTTGYKYFADFALVFCTGGRVPVDAVYTVIVDSDIRWAGNTTRRAGHDYETIAVQDLGTIYLYWGTESQGIDSVLLSPRSVSIGPGDTQDITTFPPNTPQPGAPVYAGLAAGDSQPYSGHYDRHPAYRGQCYAIFKDWKLGRDRTSVPNIQLELGRGTAWHDNQSLPHYDAGVNPVGVLFEWLTDTRFGMALPESSLNLATFDSLYASLESIGARISPLITSQNDFRQSIAELLGYYDGWIRRNGTKIEVGRWLSGNIPDGPTLKDDDLLHEPELEPQGFGPTFNEVTVVYKDRQHHYNDYIQVYRDPNNFRITGGPRPETLTRPWITDKDLAKAYARTSGAAMALPFTKGDLTVKREWLTKQTPPVLTGTVFTYNSGFYGLSFLMRLEEIEYAADKGASAKLSVEWERSKWPSLYVPPGFQGPGGLVIGPRAIWQSSITEVPYLMADQAFDTQLIALAVRGNVEVQGFRTWISFDGGSTYGVFPSTSSTSSFASFGRTSIATLSTGYRVDFFLYGVDLDLVQSQLPAAALDDALLLFIGSEVMSVYTVTPKGNGEFYCICLRGRFGTLVQSHPLNTNIFFLFRERLHLLDNAAFVAGTTIQVKLQPFTADTDFDLGSVTPISYTIVGFHDIAAPIFAPPGGAFAGTISVTISAPPAGAVARFTTDGTPVTIGSQQYSAAIPLSATDTIRARFYSSNGQTSPEVQATYTKVVGTLPPTQPSPPSYTFTGTRHHTSIVVTLAATSPRSVVRYIKNDVGGGGTAYTTPITLACATQGETLEFWATLGGVSSSHVYIDNSRVTNYGGGSHHIPPIPP